MCRRAVAAVVLCLLPAGAAAQEAARFSLDSTIAIDLFQGQNTVDDPNIVIDVTAAARLGERWLVYIRPWFREPRLPHPQDPAQWEKEIYQAAIQYERPGRVATRVDAGYIASPIGLGMMDTRPGVNPVIMTHLSYVQPLPAFDPGAPRVGTISSSYPLGGQLTLSSHRWDARAALLASAPTRSYVIGREGNPPATPVLVAGGGLTPRMGLRIGGAVAAGEHVAGDELAVPEAAGRQFRMINGEAELAFGYTKIAGELTQTRFETAGGHETARAWFVQAMHTLAPRWFVAGRQEGVSAPGAVLPAAVPPARGPRRTFHISEATLGYRLTTGLTLRSSFVTRKAFTRTEWDQQIGVSVVWARRWY